MASKLMWHQVNITATVARRNREAMSNKDFQTDSFLLDRTLGDHHRDGSLTGGELDPDHVAAYLRQHPDFFIDYENLLSELALPHHTGDHAISLVERQVSVLRTRNRDVRGRLNRLLETARDNDRLFQKTQKLVLAILDQTDANGVVDAVQSSLRDDYQVDTCSLLLFDATSLATAREQIGALLNTRQPTCGHLRPEEIAFLFPAASKPVHSAAVVPVLDSTSQDNAPLGMLAIGSFDADHYRSGMGTMFLSYLADVLGRMIPRCAPASIN